MSSRWEVERAVLDSGLSWTCRYVMLALLTYTDNGSAVVSRQHGPSLTGLARATGLDRTTIARQLNRLETGGWVKRERPDPVLARTRGARTRYTLCPVMASGTRPLGVVAQDNQSSGVEPLGVVAENRTPSGTVPLSPDSRTSQKPQQPRGAQIVIDRTGATEAEAKAVLALIEAEKQPRSLVGLVHRIAQDGDLGDWLARVRASGQAAATADMGRRPHPFEQGRSTGYCKACTRHETNPIHASAA